MSAYTSTQSGNWSSASTWGGSGPPANGDTATVATGHAVTIDTDTTVGASGAAATVAITVNATGTLTLAAGKVLTLRGNLLIGNTTFTMAAGSTLTFDSSLAAGTPVYYVQVASAGGQTSAKMVCNGSTGSHCTVNKAVGSGNGQIRHAGAGYVGGLKATFTDFSDLGTNAGGPGYGVDAIGLNVAASGEITLTDCTFTRCSMITINSCPGDGNLTIQRCSLSAPTDPSHWVLWFQISAATTGLRLVTDNNFQAGNSIIVFAVSVGGMTFSRNVYGHAIYSGATSSTAMAECDDNLSLKSGGDVAGTSIGTVGGTVNRFYCHDGDVGSGNGGGIINPGGQDNAGTVTYNGYIYDVLAAQEDNDAFTAPSPNAAVTVRVTNAIYIPNSRGLMSGAFTAHGNANVTLSYEHCTLMAGEKAPTTTGVAAMIEGSGYQMAAGQMPVFRNNIIWCPDNTATHRLVVTSLSASQTADAFTATGLDYNAKMQLQDGTIFDGSGLNGITKNGYELIWSTNRTAIGAHDVALSGTDPVTAGPKFVDPYRNLVTWDIAFLGSAVESAWVNSHAYSVGDKVSAVSTTFYNNATVNYVCIKAHTSNSGNATNGKPGASTTTAWDTNWEPQSYGKMRAAVVAGTTYSVGGVSYAATRALYEWVRAGFAPRETSLKNAAHDGTSDIGAVPVLVAAPTGSGAALLATM